MADAAPVVDIRDRARIVKIEAAIKVLDELIEELDADQEEEESYLSQLKDELEGVVGTLKGEDNSDVTGPVLGDAGDEGGD